MNSWVGLLKKEFRLTRTLTIAGLAIIAVAFIIAYFMTLRWELYPIILGMTALTVMGHVAYLAIYMFVSLQAESNKLHLWLHNPQPSLRLLGAKLVNGAAANFVSLAVSIALLMFSLNFVSEGIETHLPFNIGVVFQEVLIFAGFLFLTSIYISLWLIAAWTVYQFCKAYIGKWSFIIVLIGFLAISTLQGMFENTAIFETLTNWGYISVTSLNSHFFEGIHVGDILYYLVISVALFGFSCFLLDRKVEV
ncbi:hypothetical protein [Bacillus horti]|uniref:ABC transporter permease n=1 Tax=Caldalkalibacillus horti TaxID=77523 RepID=A0ABT9W4L9_9BACI|nr:hypothetical protein [Bacillus horti]MDQ0168188.1 hypothetical protein [Bacillus horti]